MVNPQGENVNSKDNTEKLISGLKSGDEIKGKAFVVKFRRPPSKYAGGYKFELRLGDASREIMMKFWGPNDEEKVQKLFDSIKPDDVVILKSGKVGEWNGKLEISVNDINALRVCAPGELDPKIFVRASGRGIDAMLSELRGLVSDIKDPEIRKVLDAFFIDSDFIEKYCKAPAAMYKHHGWIGGLMEHSLNVARVCGRACETYPELNRDLAISGALLHDIGKIREFTVTNNIRTSDEGMLVGHIMIGAEMMHEKLKDVDVSEVLKLKFLHIISSHHGKQEYGSPKKPAFPEALVIYYADELDAKCEMMLELVRNTHTEDTHRYTEEFGNVYLK